MVPCADASVCGQSACSELVTSGNLHLPADQAVKVYNKRDTNIPADAVYVGRHTVFGNPFVIGWDGTREEVIAKFKNHLLSNPQLMQRVKQELKGKSLICWCAPAACHADVLMHYANEP